MSALLFGALSLTVACSDPIPGPESLASGSPEVSREGLVRGPLVVLTLASARADMVGFARGEPAWTPEFDRLAGEAEWAGTAVAASSSPIPALATLLSGVPPWRHQAIHHRFGRLRPRITTLAERLSRLGYSSLGIFPREHRLYRYGFFDGFSKVIESRGGDLDPAIRALETLEGQKLVWVHLPDVESPYRDRRDQVPWLAEPGAAGEALGSRGPGSRESTGPRRFLSVRELMPFTDPERPMPPDLVATARELYGHGLAAADLRLGRLLAALGRSPDRERLTLVVTALHGFELGERGQALYAQNLGRESIEVPLILDLPEGESRPSSAEKRVSAERIWSTLVVSAGGELAPGEAPDLFRNGGAAMLSSLYVQGGRNQLSLVAERETGGVQLHWVRTVFEHPELYAAQAVEAGADGIELSQSPRVLHRRLDAAFLRSLPLTGEEEPEVRLELWDPAGGTRILDAPDLEETLARELRETWLRFVGEERSYEDETRLWSPRE